MAGGMMPCLPVVTPWVLQLVRWGGQDSPIVMLNTAVALLLFQLLQHQVLEPLVLCQRCCLRRC